MHKTMEPMFFGLDSNTNILIAISVGIWWTANSITAVTSKTLMRGELGKPDKTTWSDAIKDFRWLELTFLQHLIGAIVSIVWIKLVSRKSIWPAEGSKKIILISSVGNVVGNLSTNAAYAIVSSSMTQVVKACEPLFMFGLSLFLYRDYKVLNATTLLAIIIMVIGASLFVAFDSTFMVTGLLAAICSNVAFPIRNIYLKKLGKVWENAFQKYAVLSINSVLVLTPLIFMKLVFFQSISLVKYWHQGLFSSICHCTYNLASIHVLQSFTPLSHAILNLLKRGIVIIANMAFFQLPISWKMIIGLGAVLVGLYIYLYRNVRGDKFSPPTLLLVLVVIALGSIFFIPSAPIKTVTTIFRASGPDSAHKVNNINKRPPIDLNNVLNDIKNSINKLNLPVDTSFDQSAVIRSAWVYDRPFSHEILSNLGSLTKRSSVIVYCGNSHCMDSINTLKNYKITAEFLFLHELFKDTPLESWLSKHSFYKVLAQTSYEDHLQEAVRLCLLLKYGGVYMDPNVQIQGDQTIPFSGCIQPWISASDNIQHFRLACFQPQDSYLNDLMKNLNDAYYKNPKDNLFVVSFDNAHVLVKDNEVVTKRDFSYTLLSLEPDVEWNHHYGTFLFDQRVKRLRDANLGDEIQGFPGLQFLPFLDNFFERDNLDMNRNSNQSITVFFNAWWGDKLTVWPPQNNIEAFLFSIHIGAPMESKWTEHLFYLMERAPIGCRDISTLEILSKVHVPAYFSACMTIMIQYKSKKTDEIFIVDVRKDVYEILPEDIRKKSVYINHGLWGLRFGNLARFAKAFNIIERYSRAKLVITQRIHSALPCVGMGTPVIFINSPDMPGGGGSKNTSSVRTLGLTNMFHTLDMYNISHKQAIRDWFAEFPWDNPPPNPDMATMMRLRATFWYQIRDRPSLFDSARKFGLIPLHPPSPCKDRMDFHILFLLPDSQFTWQDHRSIESILRYHPCANVRIHSNTFDDSRLNVFRESGYQVNTVSLDHGELFRGSKLEMFETAIQSAPNPLRKSLLCAAILYKWGGFYMDSNVIITKSLANFPPKFLAWKDASKTEIDTLFMHFLKEEKYLEKIIEKYSQEVVNPNIDIFAQHFQLDSSNIEILTPSQYYGQLTLEQCYKTDTSTKALKEKLSSSVAVALPTDYPVTKTIGTKLLDSELICTQLLRDSCVLCSKLLHSV